MKTSITSTSQPLSISGFLIALAFLCFAFLPETQAVSPPLTPDPGPKPVSNTADGQNALLSITTGIHNTAIGFDSLLLNSAGNFNTAVGSATLLLNVGDPGALEGIENTAVGVAALLNNTTGAGNTAIGFGAGINQDVGSNDIYIGDAGVAGETNVIAIGGIPPNGTAYTDTFIGGVFGAAVSAATAVPVFVDVDGKLGTALVGDAPGRQGARSQAMHNQSARSKFEELQATVARQQKEIAMLTAQLKEQAAQIEKVSAQIELNKPAPQTVANK
jgi:hypothetical protein